MRGERRDRGINVFFALLILLIWAALWTIGARYMECEQGAHCVLAAEQIHRRKRPGSSRLYTLFQWDRMKKRWERASMSAFPLKMAREHYRNALLYQTLQGLRVSLRPLSKAMIQARREWIY